mmetsp:Transcript_105347/g.235180  ORF Transcript_105347/g.235180 Transcript_105347/m.235180 type:complete len:375 (-) Transcript_105347:916-2040(-)
MPALSRWRSDGELLARPSMGTSLSCTRHLQSSAGIPSGVTKKIVTSITFVGISTRFGSQSPLSLTVHATATSVRGESSEGKKRSSCFPTLSSMAARPFSSVSPTGISCSSCTTTTVQPGTGPSPSVRRKTSTGKRMRLRATPAACGACAPLDSSTACSCWSSCSAPLRSALASASLRCHSWSISVLWRSASSRKRFALPFASSRRIALFAKATACSCAGLNGSIACSCAPSIGSNACSCWRSSWAPLRSALASASLRCHSWSALALWRSASSRKRFARPCAFSTRSARFAKATASSCVRLNGSIACSCSSSCWAPSSSSSASASLCCHSWSASMLFRSASSCKRFARASASSTRSTRIATATACSCARLNVSIA